MVALQVVGIRFRFVPGLVAMRRTRLRYAAALLSVSIVASGCTVFGLAGECEGTQIIGIFDQIGDLPRAANVQSADVEIGDVTNIELDGWDARVTMCLDPGREVPRNVEAVIRTTSLLGEKFVDLQPKSSGAPYLEGGEVLGLDQTSKATELEDVFAKLAAVLGTGNLEQINRFTSAQAKILRGRASQVREVLSKLRKFTDILADRRVEIADAIDSLDAVAQQAVGESAVLRSFLRSFADSSDVLANNKEGLQSLVFALDRFSNIAAQLLAQTERGVNQQFQDLRPILRTVVGNSGRVRRTLQTLATFTQYFPETMPGDYLQLDVCQAAPDHYEPGTSCPQSVKNDDPKATSSEVSGSKAIEPASEGAVDLIFRLPLLGAER
jgi:phospholipid/cholesterol/gamma-HCH transport system substrate-binding protein